MLARRTLCSSFFARNDKVTRKTLFCRSTRRIVKVVGVPSPNRGFHSSGVIREEQDEYANEDPNRIVLYRRLEPDPRLFMSLVGVAYTVPAVIILGLVTPPEMFFSAVIPMCGLLGIWDYVAVSIITTTMATQPQEMIYNKLQRTVYMRTLKKSFWYYPLSREFWKHGRKNMHQNYVDWYEKFKDEKEIPLENISVPPEKQVDFADALADYGKDGNSRKSVSARFVVDEPFLKKKVDYTLALLARDKALVDVMGVDIVLKGQPLPDDFVPELEEIDMPELFKQQQEQQRQEKEQNEK